MPGIARLKTIVFLMAMLTIFILISGGYLFYASLKESFLESSHQAADNRIEESAYEIDASLTAHQNAVGALAGIEAVRRAVVSNHADRLAGGNAVLDHFQKSLKVSVCYLMDKNGTCIAASNRNAPDSFVGQNYRFRPYFKDAIEGKPSIYMALGVTSGIRGVYISHPVFAAAGRVPAGVVVVKDRIEVIDRKMQEAREGTAALINPDGLIFACSRKEWLYHFLWEASPEALKRTAGSRQFGKGPWNWTGMKRTSENRAVDKSGLKYRIHDANLSNYPGWKLVFLHDERSVTEKTLRPLSRTAGISILVFCVTFGTGIFILYRKAALEILLREKLENEQKETIRKLQKAKDEIGMLEEILPICSHCKKIRDQEDNWEQIETYVAKHARVDFSHGICPDCMKKYFPQEYRSIMRDEK